jgi:hypothetical protein
MQQGKRAELSGHTSRVEGLQKVIGWDPSLSRTDLKGCRLRLHSPGDHALQVVISLRRYSQSRCESPRPFYWCILNASNEQESRMCLALRRIFAEMTRGVFNFPVGCATFADKQCTARKLESVLVPQSINEQRGHSQSGDAI